MAGALMKTRNGGLRTWLGGEPFNSFRKEMDDMFARFGLEPENWPTLEHVPALDLSETETAVEVKMDVPGFKPEDIEVHVRGNLLTISGSKKEEKEEKKDEKDRAYHRVERRQGSFSRGVTLPCEVVGAKANAEYKDGVLVLTMPKTDPVQTQKIAVNAAR
jgi:HSP20 family protein